MSTDLGNRIALTRIIWRVRTRSPLNQKWMGIIVARQLGRAKPFSKMTVSHWEAGSSEPDTATLATIAKLAGVDPGWLAFGAASSGQDPFQAMDAVTQRLVESEMSLDKMGGLSGYRAPEVEAADASEKQRKLAGRRLATLLRRQKEIAAMPDGKAKVRAMERLLFGGRRKHED
ncbi:MAG: helix-turn-helix domain-containing protein [Gemmatimonadetes bacterium]|nr:helix-turn-helix domain-containing protein [Gemmatimonadota bacterium]